MHSELDILNEFRALIHTPNKSNSYKCIWAKAIIEASLEDIEDGIVPLTFISETFIDAFWNLLTFSKLNQSNNTAAQPEFSRLVSTLIGEFVLIFTQEPPLPFYKAKAYIESNENLSRVYEKTVSDGVKSLKKDVAHRFLNLNNEVSWFYEYDKLNNYLKFDQEVLACIKKYSSMLQDSVTLAWATFVEDHDNSPKIIKKLSQASDGSVAKRKSLTKFKTFLDLENSTHTCFKCVQPIHDTPAIDHVLPWSYIYSDDLFNLVYVHQTCNSSKGNQIPTQDTVHRLLERNKRLLALMLSQNSNKKQTEELRLSLEHNWLQKNYIQLT
jgi:5-methylcytosine-specific restriction endonuclease McrA